MDIESAISDLYALTLEEFVEARNTLAKQLSGDRRREDARRVRALRRPTLPAWTVNQVTRRHPDLVVRLEESGARLLRVQQRLLSGSASRDDLRDARSERDGILREIVSEARRLLQDEHRATTHLDEVASTFEAVSVNPEVAAEVREGRLTKPVAVPATLGPPGLHLVPRQVDPPAEPTEEPPAEPPAREGPDDARRDQGAEQALRQEREEQEARREREERQEQEARRQRELEERAARLRGELNETMRQLASAESELRAEQAELERRRSQVAALADQADQLRQRQASLEEALRALEPPAAR